MKYRLVGMFGDAAVYEGEFQWSTEPPEIVTFDDKAYKRKPEAPWARRQEVLIYVEVTVYHLPKPVEDRYAVSRR